MTSAQISYIVFGAVLILALAFDLGLLSKKSTVITTKKALLQTIFWVLLACGFGVFLIFQDTQQLGLEYFSAYLMEWSLSIDNIFVFILIFTYFGVRETHYGRVLLVGILMAIVLRAIFITVGIGLVNRIHAILYVFGAFLVYTGFKMFTAKKEDEADLTTNRVYKFLQRILPLTTEEEGVKLTIVRNGKKLYTKIFVVIIMLATTDVIFAVDSIPAVFAISQKPLVVYTSNIFAVLGLRSLFFLLKGAVNKFGYLQQGIAVVLIFIGVKMLLEMDFIGIHIPAYVSLLVIVCCIIASILYSIQVSEKDDQRE